MRRTAPALLVVPVAVIALMGVDLPDSGPVPKPDPREAVTESDDSEPDSGGDRASSGPDASGSSDKAETAPEKPDSAKLPGILAPEVDAAALSACEKDLRQLGVAFERVDPVVGKNGCGVRAPYAVTEIANGVKLRPATKLRCATVRAMANWVDRVVIPAASALPGDVRLTRINHGSTYVCRRRNNLPTGKMSEHSIGNAVDVMSFEFAGRDPIAISPRAGKGTVEEAFQRAVRAGACLDFTTVLGPGSDASHDDHLHLDIRERRGGYRLCQ